MESLININNLETMQVATVCNVPRHEQLANISSNEYHTIKTVASIVTFSLTILIKKYRKYVLILAVISAISCSKNIYETNGETIYKTGKNIKGEKILDKNASRITIFHSCTTCHGKDGNAMNNVSIKFSYLSNPKKFSTPYTDSLFYRFIDHDLKSDGTKANIGVIWKMNDKDKKELLDYLKTL